MKSGSAGRSADSKWLRKAAVSVGVIVCTIAGFLGAALSLLAAVAVGVVTIGLGLLLVRRRRLAGPVVVACAVALLVGAGAYALLGLLQPDGAATGTG